MTKQSGVSDREVPTFKYALLVLVSYCLHNGWNGWTFLNTVVTENASKELFGISSSELGLLTTAGWCGIFSCMPLTIFCTWRKTLLFCAGALNAAAPVLRYFAAAYQIFVLECISFFATGAAYSIFSVWSPIIAACFFPPNRWAFVTAVGGISNFVGGGLAAVLMPLLSGGTSAGLLRIFQCQAYLASMLALSMLSWIWIPALVDEQPRGSRKDFHVCRKTPVVAHICLYGINIGIPAAISGLDSSLLQGLGLSSPSAGWLTCLFLVSSVFSICIGSWVTNRRRLQRLIAWLHVAQVTTCGCWLALCWFVSENGSGTLTLGLLATTQILQGVSQMGSFPFFVQEVVCLAHPATENFSGGFTLLIGMGVAMVVNQVAMSIAPLSAAILIFVAQVFQAMLFSLCTWWWRDSEIMMDTKLESFTGSHIGSHIGNSFLRHPQ